MHRALKRASLHIFKLLGFFSVSRSITRQAIRILCYHGFSVSDESEFRPETFMSPNTFKSHIDVLVSSKYPVISLKEAVRLLETESFLPCSVVITFDDGFKTFEQYALPVLRHYRLPSTVFVTTYYSVKKNPVFRLALQYMFWKTEVTEIDLTGTDISLTGRFSLDTVGERNKIAWAIIDFAENGLKETDRCRLAVELGVRLNVPYENIVNHGALSIMGEEAIKRISLDGVDVQLHTHRHNFPEDSFAATREIRDNRAVLEPIVGKELRHFCYPSGIWNEKQFPVLIQQNIESALTCDTGFNYSNTPRLALKRFLDGEHISKIEFEAELSGFMEIMRCLRTKLCSV